MCPSWSAICSNEKNWLTAISLPTFLKWLSVAYDMEDGLIKRARIYLMVNVLLQQIGPAPAPR